LTAVTVVIGTTTCPPATQSRHITIGCHVRHNIDPG